MTGLNSVIHSLDYLLYLLPVHAGVLLDLPPDSGQHGGVHDEKLQVWEGDPARRNNKG